MPRGSDLESTEWLKNLSELDDKEIIRLKEVMMEVD